MEKCGAIVLAAGQGKRMGSSTPKQFLMLQEKPIVYYSLKCFEEMPQIQEVVLVTGEESIDYCKKEIVETYGFGKVTKVVAGGKERYDSVYEGLKQLEGCRYVYIHDGARPFIDQRILQDCLLAVREYGACVTAVKSKDTIKIADEQDLVVSTPNRAFLWNIQTPQVFDYQMIRSAHEKIREGDMSLVTDDAMIIESLGLSPVKLVTGSYHNIKITTPEDLIVAENILKG